MTALNVDARIRTVTGPAQLSALTGRVLSREHLRLDLRWPVRADSDPHRWLDEELHVAAELTALRKEHELGLVVELTCLGMGRDASALARISAASRVAVVASTGYFTDPFHPLAMADMDHEQIAERLIAEIGFGMDGTSVLPGVIGEVGFWGETPTPGEEKALKGAALAALETSLPVATYGRPGLAQLEILMEMGVAPERIAVGQQDVAADPGVHRKIAELGAYVSFGDLAHSGDASLKFALELIEAGHADRLLLGSGVTRQSHIAHYGGPGFGAVLTEFVPALRACGVDDGTLDLITRENTLRWLSSRL
ncbi:aryldialkylphosphatase [Actinocorallia sp. A-T 12471]|uniref:phosphotriesterase family protein n=1 Tax=Actinocorallia sp. A-T 12471 TaxID=3089813 RepID=UPI0029D1CE4A|nr:aryldialkylphosphatase [Actinocorallia sp. A-T 12471]MDX6739509.1 aryldialkylphosphatase [Actinocorallia sp. A-T 12471]